MTTDTTPTNGPALNPDETITGGGEHTTPHVTAGVAAPGGPPVGRRPGPTRGLAPTTDWDLVNRANGSWGSAWWWHEKHDVLAGRWATLDTWARLLLALAASLSAVSLLADDPVVTGVLAVVTAMFSAVNAALDPATRAASHRQASRDFRHIERRLGVLLGTVSSLTGTGYGSPDPNAPYVPVELTAEMRSVLAGELLQLEDALEAVWDAAPAINRLFGAETNATPRTSWGVRRLRKRLERQREAAAIRDEIYAQPAPEDVAFRG